MLAAGMPDAPTCVSSLTGEGYLAGMPHPAHFRDLLIAVTEKRTRAPIEGLVKALDALKA